MPIKNYTTEVPAERTVGEIVGLLASKGAHSVRVDYDGLGIAVGISFIVVINALPIPFKLPCNFAGVKKSMAGKYKDRWAKQQFEKDPNTDAKVRRIAWRILKDWVAAQMAIIEAEQASLIQVFMPYATDDKGITTYDRFLENINNQKQLGAGQ